MTTILWDVPALDIDKFLGKPTHQVKLERRIVWNLLHTLQGAGFTIDKIEDHDGEFHFGTIKDHMEVLFDCEYSFVHVYKPGHDPHVISLINGNGVDIISDWTFDVGDKDGFNSLMDNFNTEDYR